MARVIFSAGEVDLNFKIEDGIRLTLSERPTAEVAAAAISNHDLLDHDGEVCEGSLESKCDQIARETNATYSFVGPDIVFRAQVGAVS